jgi:hypothetical protein
MTNVVTNMESHIEYFISFLTLAFLLLLLTETNTYGDCFVEPIAWSVTKFCQFDTWKRVIIRTCHDMRQFLWLQMTTGIINRSDTTYVHVALHLFVTLSTVFQLQYSILYIPYIFWYSHTILRWLGKVTFLLTLKHCADPSGHAV